MKSTVSGSAITESSAPGVGVPVDAAAVSGWRSALTSAAGATTDDADRIDLLRAIEELKCAAEAAQAEGIRLCVVKLEEAKRGFVLLPRRWVVERSFGWMSRFRRLSRDYERLSATLAGYHFVAFALLMGRSISAVLHNAPCLQAP